MEDLNNLEYKRSGAWFLFSFRGRINRKPYCIFNLSITLAGVFLGLFTGPVTEISDIGNAQLAFMLWIFWPSLAIQAKRWHDCDKSALWILINLIPIAGPVWALIENCLQPGTPGDNRFGPNPLEQVKERD